MYSCLLLQDRFGLQGKSLQEFLTESCEVCVRLVCVFSKELRCEATKSK